MSLVTRCPSCGTAFRAQRAQLTAKGGTVRCGKCGETFDGIAALVEETGEELALEPSPQLGLFDPSRRPPPAPAAPAPGPLPRFMEESRTSRAALWTWGLLALAALAALSWQAAWRYRVELAAVAPQSHAVLAAGCKVLGCRLELPRRPELMSIDSSDLQADPRQDGLIVLNAVIRNRARFAQDYPALELTLTDAADRPVLRKVLAPRDYLAAEDRSAAGGIPAGTDTALRIFLDAGRTPATGYRLYLFYPS